MPTSRCWRASAASQVTDSFGLQAGRVVRRWPNLVASVAVFRFEQR